MLDKFKLHSPFVPKGDQMHAIQKLVKGIKNGCRRQTLLGATGTGKTFVMAKVIEKINKPTLVIVHNKTLAAQITLEFKEFFPDNAVEYFVSYYDYYQPEAYIPQTDTYIEKDASINENIEKMRLSATTSLFERKDVLIVASVSCIYGLGSPEDYLNLSCNLKVGDIKDKKEILRDLIIMQYSRNDLDLSRGHFRAIGDVIEIFPAYEENTIRIELFGDEIEKISKIHKLKRTVMEDLKQITLYPASHFVTPEEKINKAIEEIKIELELRLIELEKENRIVEAQRLKQRVNYDIEMMSEMEYCSGIENYSRHLAGRPKGSRAQTLIDYFISNIDSSDNSFDIKQNKKSNKNSDFLIFIDESHITIPQIGGMYAGDRSRKEKLVEYGFRLPSALDNRPLMFHEFEEISPQTIYLSATPGSYELEHSEQITEQIIRPTGLLDPEIEVKPIKMQIDDIMNEIQLVIERNERVLVTTLTKKMAEDLTEFLSESGINVRYLHSDIVTLERTEILRDLRLGKFDVLIGINLLREGLDLPEVSLVAILDADKEGFLRSERSLIQTIGRAARNVNGKVIMYADRITNSMERAIDETNRRRRIQGRYNLQRGIVPKTIVKQVRDVLMPMDMVVAESKDSDYTSSELASKTVILPDDAYALIIELEKKMHNAADNLDFEIAAKFRDEIKEIKIKFL
ncbi:MAG: excinuclease ABC subunit UvrB [Methanosarcinaceae archaeon]|nr:excinuclease ABC subunit UvrB [Methanosarcinaceae archaeon]